MNTFNKLGCNYTNYKLLHRSQISGVALSQGDATKMQLWTIIAEKFGNFDLVFRETHKVNGLLLRDRIVQDRRQLSD